MSTPRDLWPEVSRLLDEALELEDAARRVWFDSLKVRAPTLASHLAPLLVAHEHGAAHHVMQGPPSELIAAALSAQSGRLAAASPGQMLGPYRLLTPIGEGGMASVWLAEQTLNVRRRVALKIPRYGVEGAAAMAARFHHERDFLAGLEHPHIARLYDAGVTDDGQPYLVMEWIDGQHITSYADAGGLTVGQRIELFRQVLRAVRHAHTRLVIHRDLKPSNILVTADGEVKLLDFGIARLLSEGLPIDSSRPALSQLAMTPEAASPEQLAGDPLATTSDVYSLGVVLYELVVGIRPYRLRTSGVQSSSEALHAALMAVTILRPSVAGIEVATAASRGTTVAGLRRTLAGDLDAILTKALMKDPSLRYQSTDEFGADLHRWQEGHPVTARRATPMYRLGRFFSRNRAGVLAAGAVMLVLLAGLGTSLWQAERARQEAQLAHSVQAFLTKLFAASDPEQARGQDIGAKELLARGAARVEAELKDQPAILAPLQQQIGTIYFQLGDNVTAIAHLHSALALYAKTGDEATEPAIDTECAIAKALGDEEQFAQDRQAAARCMRLADANFGPRNRWRLLAQTEIAWSDIETGHPQAGADLLQAAIAEAESLTPRPELQIQKARTVLGDAWLGLGQLERARDVFAEQVRIGLLTPGVELTDQMVDRLNLARVQYLLEQFELASAELAALVPLMDKQIGPAHDRTIRARSLWSQALAEVGEYDRAVAVERANLDAASRRPSIDADMLNFQKLVLAKVLKIAARPAEALPLAVEGLAFEDAKYPEPYWVREAARRIVGELLLQNGRVDDAVALLHQASANGERIDGHASNAKFADLLQAEALARWRRGRQGDAHDALLLLDQAHSIYVGSLSVNSRATLRCAVHRSWIEAMIHPEDAAINGAFRRATEAFEATLPSTHVGHAELLLMQAELKRRSGDTAGARRDAEAGATSWMSVVHSEFKPPLYGLH